MCEDKKSRFSIWMDRLDKSINLFCVIFLFIQVLSIIVMVFGRYLFRYVPRGTEQLSLFCMVWFSLLSISLSIRDDSHIKMEIMDAIFPKKHIVYFQYFAAIMTFLFSIYMVFYGMDLYELTRTTMMSGVRVSEGWLYFSLPVSGICMAIASLALIIEKVGSRYVD